MKKVLLLTCIILGAFACTGTTDSDELIELREEIAISKDQVATATATTVVPPIPTVVPPILTVVPPIPTVVPPIPTETNTPRLTNAQINKGAEILDFFDAQSPSGIINAQRLAVRSLVERAKWAVVEIVVDGSPQGSGTFISSDGYVITAGHVVRADVDHGIITYEGEEFPATLIAYNSSFAPDLAILKVDGEDFPFVPIGFTASVGELATYVGHPDRLLWAGAGGIVTDIDRSEEFDIINYTNPSSSGGSGSAILSIEGDLIGLVSGVVGNSLPRSTITTFQSEPIWSAIKFKSLLDTYGFGPSVDVVVEFIEEHVPGLVQANRVARNNAVTVDTDFVTPTIPSDLCRICIHYRDYDLAEYVLDIPPLQEFLFLERMMDSMQEPDDITVQERDLIRSVGQSIQPAVVMLEVQTAKDVFNDTFSTGTGFFVSPDGYLITNAHVVENAQVIEVTTFDGQILTGMIVGSVSENWTPDLALVKVESEAQSWVPLASSVSLEELVVGVGHPQGLEWAMYGGRLSAWDYPESWEVPNPEFQSNGVDVGVGSSGSPVVNMTGELIGVVANGGSDRNFLEQCQYAAGNILQAVLFWDQASMDAAKCRRLGGPRVDTVREFIEDRVPGLLEPLKE